MKYNITAEEMRKLSFENKDKRRIAKENQEFDDAQFTLNSLNLLILISAQSGDFMYEDTTSYNVNLRLRSGETVKEHLESKGLKVDVLKEIKYESGYIQYKNRISW